MKRTATRSMIIPSIITMVVALFCAGCSYVPHQSTTPQPVATPAVTLQVISLDLTQATSSTTILTPTPQLVETNNDSILSVPSAANAALMLRLGEDSVPVSYWDTAQPDASKLFRLRKAVRAMLFCTVNMGALPVGRDGIQFQADPEIPLMEDGATLPGGLDYNTRGSIYSNSPLTSVTASFVPRGGGQGETQTVIFDPSQNMLDYSLDTKSEYSARSGIGDLFDISDLPSGKYTFTLSATSVALSAPVTLYKVNCSISESKDTYLTQNKFDDNYFEVNRFFNGDTSKFLFQFWIRDGRSISTDTEWREVTIVESSLGRVNVGAVPNFELANYYLEHTYFSVTIVNRKLNRQTDGRVTLLKNLISKEVTYVPRFQSNLQYVSHHTLGLAIDVNDDMYPNKNIITNHDLIGDDVRNHLIYNGIKTDENGQQYYDFTYDGKYSPRFERVPKTIVNYLLYELAFFRAGFQWGYYYETTCDGMHFTLAEMDINKHMYSDVGLRKVYDYIQDTDEPTLASFRNNSQTPMTTPKP